MLSINEATEIRARYLRMLPDPILYELRRNRFRLRFPSKFQDLQKYRKSPGHSGLGPFDEFQAIFIHIPKCAGTSVSRSLFGYSVGSHHSVADYQLIYPWSAFRSYFKFAIVRNPFDRLVSAFHYLKQGGGNESDAEWVRNHDQHFKGFKSFVKYSLRTPEILGAMHFRPQIEYVRDFRNEIPIDYIGRYERLGDAFLRISTQLGSTSELRSLNQNSARNHGAFQDCYEDVTRRIVAEVYAEDIARFGYTFEDE